MSDSMARSIDALGRLRALARRHGAGSAPGTSADACSWDVLRATYEEQAARGVPEAIVGLERIRAGRWPSSGLPRTD